MNYRIMERGSFQVIGMKHVVNIQDEILTPTYEEMINGIGDARMKEFEELSTDEPGGIVHLTTNYEEDLKVAAHFHQYIGAVSSVERHETFASLEVPAMTWAIFEVDGDWMHVEEQWQRIYTEWFPTVPHELVGPEMLASQNDKSEIWIGIKEK